MSQKMLLNSKEINIILRRLACQLVENHPNFENTVIIGIQPRGVFLAVRIPTKIKTKMSFQNDISISMDMMYQKKSGMRLDILVKSSLPSAQE